MRPSDSPRHKVFPHPLMRVIGHGQFRAIKLSFYSRQFLVSNAMVIRFAFYYSIVQRQQLAAIGRRNRK